MRKLQLNILWFRRDLRLDDNIALDQALSSGLPVLPIFIFDTNITRELPREDSRITFIYESLSLINNELLKSGSSLRILKGKPSIVWKTIIESFDIKVVFINKDYEPYAIRRDEEINLLLKNNGIRLISFKDQVIFEEKEILKPDNNPYTVFTPYRKKWLQKFSEIRSFISSTNSTHANTFHKFIFPFPSLKELGFSLSSVKVRPYELSNITNYDKLRDIPSADKTTYLGPYLRFGIVSIRRIIEIAASENEIFLNELIWREFFMQILFNYTHVITGNFKLKYNELNWRNDGQEFEKWCEGTTGYPIVDAGMRQLNRTGYMHNRVRMITAGFLCKHLLIDWRLGEAYFAQKLNDYELSSNNGNWQWAAGTGCDASPYFRIFNPYLQQNKFDPLNEYVRKWVEDIGKNTYPKPIVDHEFARARAISVYRSAISYFPSEELKHPIKY